MVIGTSRARFEAELVAHYDAERAASSRKVVDDLVRAMLAEDRTAHGPRRTRMGTAAFVAAQARYIPAWTWAAQAALVALMCLTARAAGNAGMTKLAVGMLAALTVLVGVPTMHASKLHGVAELEYACPHNVASVLVARLVVLGCSSALAAGAMVGVTAASLDASAFDVALWACPPFFCSCAGSLLALRKAAPSSAMVLCIAWTATCCGALVALAATESNAYASASLATWAVAALVALAWLARELAQTLRAAAAGLDAFAPHLARTYH